MRHADEGRVEVGGSDCDQGQEEAQSREAKRRRVFVEGREDKECNMDCGGSAQEEGNAKEEGSVEEGGGVQEEGFAVEEPGTYEAERNKRVAKVQEQLQLLLSAKYSMWVGSICGFLLFFGCGCSLFPFARTRSLACGQWSLT